MRRIALLFALLGFDAAFAQQALTLADISPSSALAGTTLQITLTGTGFAAPSAAAVGIPGATVLLRRNNADTSLTTTFVSSTTLRATIPGSLIPTGPATVQILVENRLQCTTNCARSNTRDFQVVAPLQISQVLPDRGVANTSVNINVSGSGFVGVSALSGFGPSTIIWRRGSVETRLTTTVNSTTSLSATIPASLMTGSGFADILVENGNPNFCDGPCPRSNALPFTILPLSLSTLTPNRAPTRAANGLAQDLILNGQGFASNAQVFWQPPGAAAIQLIGSRVSGTTQIDVQIPPGLLTQPLIANVFVRNPGGSEFPSTDSNTLPFTVFVALELTRLDPPFLPAGSPATRITAIGQGFTPNTRIAFRDNGGIRTPGGQLVNTTAGTIELTAGAELFTTQKVWEVIAVDGSTTSNAVRFEVTAGVVITSLDPPTRTAGTGVFELTVNGSGFGEGSVVLFGDQSLAPTTRNPTQLRVNVTPPANPGRVDVRVRVGSGATAITSNALPLEFIAPGPVITSLSPPSRAINSGDFDLVISGRNFLPAPTVTVGGQPANISGSPSATSITVRVSNARLQQLGPVPVVVRVNGVNSDPFNFQVASNPPVITSLNPPNRALNGGDFDLTITGRNFLPSPTVTFRGQAVPVSGTPTATSITVRVANTLLQQPGPAAVVVRVDGADSEPADFQITANPPVISSFNPTTVAANSGNFALTITGQNFLPSPTVTFRGQAVPISGTPTATAIVVQVPNALIAQAGDVSVVVRVNNVDSRPATFGVTLGGPVISSLNPPNRAAGSGDFTLTIAGQNLAPNPSVTFDGQPVTITGTPTATSIQVAIPNARIQTVKSAAVQVQVGTQTTSTNFAITAPQVPPAAVTSAAASVNAGGNTTASVTLSAAAPVQVTGTLELGFTPNAAGLPANFTDPALVFVSGGQRRINFTIPAGQTNATIPGNGAFNVGTVAGTVTLSVTALSAAGADLRPPDPRNVTIPRTAPAIQQGSARLTNSPGGVTIELQGSSSSRDITQAAVTFTIASGVNVNGSSSFTVPLQQAFTAWFTSDLGRSNGSRFLLQIPFTVPEGDPNQITGFSITLTGPDGASPAVTGGR